MVSLKRVYVDIDANIANGLKKLAKDNNQTKKEFLEKLIIKEVQSTNPKKKKSKK